jgi:hypothetical protein
MALTIVFPIILLASVLESGKNQQAHSPGRAPTPLGLFGQINSSGDASLYGFLELQRIADARSQTLPSSITTGARCLFALSRDLWPVLIRRHGVGLGRRSVMGRAGG